MFLQDIYNVWGIPFAQYTISSGKGNEWYLQYHLDKHKGQKECQQSYNTFYHTFDLIWHEVGIDIYVQLDRWIPKIDLWFGRIKGIKLRVSNIFRHICKSTSEWRWLESAGSISRYLNSQKLHSKYLTTSVAVDFKKAYDTVNRALLIKRLQFVGINGIFMRNIMAMYEKTEYCIKLKDGHTRPIKSNFGLKQGCPLSPMLFNINIDDIKDIFDDQDNPIHIQNTKINYFLYADDLVILSESRAGIQRGIDKAYNFAKAKHLTISYKKKQNYGI